MQTQFPIFIFFIFFLSLTSCQENESITEPEFQYPPVAELQQISMLGSAAGEIFARPNMVLPLNDEKFIVADTQSLKLHLFDMNMNHIDTFGRAGEGPGEFQRFSEITYDGNLIRIYDGRAYRVLELSIRDNRIELVAEDDFTFSSLPDYPGAMFWRFAEGPDNSNLALYRDFNIQSEESPRFTRIVALQYDDDYSPISAEPALVFDYIAEIDFRNGILSIPYYQRGFIAHSNGRLFYAKNDQPEIHVYNTAGVQTQKIALPDTRIPLSQEDKTEAYERFYRNSPDPEMFRSEVIPEMPDYRPILRTLGSDSEGRIWARIYTNDDSNADWLVLDEEGSPLIRLSIPDGHIFRNASGNTLFTGYNGEDGPVIYTHQWTIVE